MRPYAYAVKLSGWFPKFVVLRCLFWEMFRTGTSPKSSSSGTLNEIRNAKIVVKKKLVCPDYAEGIIRCINPKCITNAEKIPTKFRISGEPLTATCHYCQTRMAGNEIANSII